MTYGVIGIGKDPVGRVLTEASTSFDAVMECETHGSARNTAAGGKAACSEGHPEHPSNLCPF